MFDWLRYHHHLTKLETKKARIIRRYAKLLEKEKKINKPKTEIDVILQSSMIETGVPYDEIVDLRCDYILKQA
jgi:hypothetical protein